MSRVVSRVVAVLLAHVRAGVDAGMSTAEYAVGTVAACGFAALLWTVLHSGTVQGALSGLVIKALHLL